MEVFEIAINGLTDVANELIDKVHKLEAKNKRLREYVKHKENCNWTDVMAQYPQCTCGLDEALKEK